MNEAAKRPSWLTRWWRGWGNRRRPSTEPEPLWETAAAALPLCFTQAVEARHLALASQFLRRKRFWGAAGLTVTPEMAATVAYGAACYLHRHGVALFDDFVGIILYPAPFAVRRRWEKESGVIHEWDDTLEGETWPQGPVVLSWLTDPAERAAVILHEFAHRFDAALGGLWDATWEAAWKRAEQAPAGELPFDEAALEAPEEFIAYSAETFFLAPQGLQAWDLGLYSRWCQLTGLDPAAGIPSIRTTREESL